MRKSWGPLGGFVPVESSRIVLIALLGVLFVGLASVSGGAAVDDGVVDPVVLDEDSSNATFVLIEGANDSLEHVVPIAPNETAANLSLEHFTSGPTPEETTSRDTSGFTTFSDNPAPVEVTVLQPDMPTPATGNLVTEWKPIPGATVDLGPGGEGETGSDGIWLSDPLYPGEYTGTVDLSTAPFGDRLTRGIEHSFSVTVPSGLDEDPDPVPVSYAFSHGCDLPPYPQHQPSMGWWEHRVENQWPNWEEESVYIDQDVAVAGEPVTIRACNPFRILDYEHRWEFDDDTTATGEEFTLVFDEPGTYDFWPVDGPTHETELTVVNLEVERAFGDEWLAEASQNQDYYQVTSTETERSLTSVTVDGVEAVEVGLNDFRAPLEVRDGRPVEVVAEFDDGAVAEKTTDSAMFVDPAWVETLSSHFFIESSDEWCELDGSWPEGDACELWIAGDAYEAHWAGIPGTVDDESFSVHAKEEMILMVLTPTGDLTGQTEVGAGVSLLGKGFSVEGEEQMDFDGVQYQGGDGTAEAKLDRKVRLPRWLGGGRSGGGGEPVYERDGIGGIDASAHIAVVLRIQYENNEDIEIVSMSVGGDIEAYGKIEGSAFGASAHGEIYGGGSPDIYFKEGSGGIPVDGAEVEFYLGVRGGYKVYFWSGDFDEELLDLHLYTGNVPGTNSLSTHSFEGGALNEQTISRSGDAGESTEWSVVSPTGAQPLPDVPAVDAGTLQPLSSDSPSVLGSDTDRLTDRPYEDSEPSIAATPDGHAVVWSSLEEGAAVEDGHDIRFRHYDESTGWGEVVDLTDTDRHDFDPTLVSRADTDELFAVWSRIDADASQLSGPEEAAPHLEIVTAHFDGDTWSEPTIVSDTGALERAPVAAASEEGWLVAWMHHANDDRLDIENATVEYRLFDADADQIREGSIENASLPAVGSRADGTFDLAYFESAANVTESGTLAHGAVDDDGFDRDGAHEYALEQYGDHAVDGGELVWTWNDGGESALEHADGSDVQRLETDPDLAGIGELVLRADGDESLLLYRGAPGFQNTSDLLYRQAVDGEWSGDHRFVGGPDEDLTIWQADAILGDDGFTAAYAVQEPGIENRNDVFVTSEAFAPAYTLDAAGPTDAAAGETVTVDTTVRNVGGASDDPVAIVVTDGDDELTRETVDALGHNETVTVPLAVTVPESGTVTVSLEAGASDEWYTQRADLRLGSPNLVVTAAEGEMHSETNATLTVGVENRGGVNVSAVPVRIDDGDGWTTNVSLDVAAGATETAAIPVDLSAFNTSALDRVTIDPEGTVPAVTSSPALSELTTRLFTPDIRLHHPITYQSVERYDTEDGTYARVGVTNYEPFATNATITVTDHDDGEFLGEKTLELPPLEGTTTHLTTVLVPLSDVSVDQTLHFDVVEQSDARTAIDRTVDEVDEVDTETLAAIDMRVYDDLTGEPLEDVTITSFTDLATTDANGEARVELTSIQALIVSKPGYKAETHEVIFTSGYELTGAVRLSPDLVVDSVELPDGVEPGESVTIDAVVRNNAFEAVSSAVEFSADGVEIASERVSLDARDETTVTVETTAPMNRSAVVYTAQAGGVGARSVTAVGVESSGSGPVSIDTIDTPDAIDVASTHSVPVTVTNDGSDRFVGVGTVSLTGYTDGTQPIGAAVFDIAAGETATREIDVVAPDTGVDGAFVVELAGDTASEAVTVREGGERVWGVQTGGQIVSSPTIVDGLVYIGTLNNQLFAVDADTGEGVWGVTTDGPIYSSPTVADGTVYVGSMDGGLYALDASTGGLQWAYNTFQPITSSPTVADGTVYLGGNVLYAIDAETGTNEWVFSREGAIDSSPTVVDGTVYVGAGAGADDEGHLYAIDAQTGTEVWELETDGDVLPSQTVADGTVYAGTAAGTLYAVDASSGEIVWTVDTNTSLLSTPTVADGVVYVGTGLADGVLRGLYAIDADTGEQRWVGDGHVHSTMSSSPTVAGGTVYVGDFSGYVHAFDTETGAYHWRHVVSEGVESAPTVADGTLYVGSLNGVLYALSTEGDHTSDDSRVTLGTLGHVGDMAEETPEFSLEILETNAPVEAGETLTVTATVENTGTAAGEQTVTLEVGGEVRDTRTVSLDPDETDSVTLEWKTGDDDAGDHEVTISSDDDSASEPITVEAVAEAVFVVDALETNAPVEAGETLTVTATVENTGTAAGEQTVALEVGGEVRDTRTVSLDPDETDSVTLEWKTGDDDAGDHEVTISSDDETVTKTVAVELPPESVFALEGVDLTTPIDAGETVTVTATVENVGDAAGETAVTLEVGGEESDSRAVSLDPGETDTVALEWRTETAGEYDLTVSVGNDSTTETVVVDEPGQAELVVAALETNAPVEAGDTLTVTATVENTGTAAGEQTVSLEVGGEVRDTRTVSLDPDETETVTLEWETGDDDVGDHDITVSSDDDSASEPITVDAVAEAVFVVDALETNTPIETGETLTVTATVENTGTAAGEQTVILEIGGEVRDARTLVLEADATNTVTLEWETTTADTGEYDAVVVTDDAVVSEPVTVDDSEEADGIDVNGITAYDPTGDGLYVDFTGDGTVGYDDAVLFFENLQSEAIQENIEAFDVIGDGRVGFADIVAVFNMA
ncbi:CARDB domain-containing protein [Natronobiforma cellulositropha]|uniref:CARDB domain-containing protein n=1 Tax=Natronobiforma cellulositropha TaxID=1679076 RepID=UPI0021D5C44A|nr:PQQ-binding-like beta-propeller repeat protein [Natronobiforma cellulositropha]